MTFNLNANTARRIATAALLGGALLMALAVCALAAWFPASLSAATQSRDAATFWPDTLQTLWQASLTCGGWLLVFAGLLLAGHQAARSRMLEALRQLFDEARSSDHAEARRQVAEAFGKLGSGVNVYAAARQTLAKLRGQKDQSKNEALKQARLAVAHFWMRAARLVEMGVLTEEEVLDGFEPDILEMLEPFETIAAEEAGALTPPRPWPAMKFYTAWLKRRGEPHKAAEWQASLPARPKLYADSRSTGEKPG
jgi:hypothetical protein